jgi:hypothetical protein
LLQGEKYLSKKLFFSPIRGIDNTLYLGVGRDETKGLVAHAWLRCGELILTGGGREHFMVVGKFSE